MSPAVAVSVAGAGAEPAAGVAVAPTSLPSPSLKTREPVPGRCHDRSAHRSDRPPGCCRAVAVCPDPARLPTLTRYCTW